MSGTPNESPDNDIQSAVESARQGASASTSLPSSVSSDVLTEASHPAWWLHCHYTLYQCSRLAEKYPCQTLAAIGLTIGCGWLCVYFGWTVLAAFLLYAACWDE